MGPTPSRVCLKPGIIRTVVGKVGGRFGKASWPVAVDFWTCPVAVPTAIAGAAVLVLMTDTFRGKYRPDAPKSTIAVDDNGGDYS